MCLCTYRSGCVSVCVSVCKCCLSRVVVALLLKHKLLMNLQNRVCVCVCVCVCVFAVSLFLPYQIVQRTTGSTFSFLQSKDISFLSQRTHTHTHTHTSFTLPHLSLSLSHLYLTLVCLSTLVDPTLLSCRLLLSRLTDGRTDCPPPTHPLCASVHLNLSR